MILVVSKIEQIAFHFCHSHISVYKPRITMYRIIYIYLLYVVSSIQHTLFVAPKCFLCLELDIPKKTNKTQHGSTKQRI